MTHDHPDFNAGVWAGILFTLYVLICLYTPY